MCYKVRKGLGRRTPGERTDRESVVLTLPDGKLLLEILERKEFMRGVEILVVLAVTALYLAVMSWSIGTDEFVPDLQLLQRFFKQGRA